MATPASIAARKGGPVAVFQRLPVQGNGRQNHVRILRDSPQPWEVFGAGRDPL